MNPGSREPKPDAASRRPRRWYPCRDESGNDLVTPEILDVLMPEDGPELSAFERQMRGGELKAILGRAARGELRDESWKPVRRDPTLWELRWKWDDGGQLRGYFHEPALDPDSTILAKVHRKEIIAHDPGATASLQDAQIDEAGIRLRRHERQRWGIQHGGPIA